MRVCVCVSSAVLCTCLHLVRLCVLVFASVRESVPGEAEREAANLIIAQVEDAQTRHATQLVRDVQEVVTAHRQHRQPVATAQLKRKPETRERTRTRCG